MIDIDSSVCFVLVMLLAGFDMNEALPGLYIQHDHNDGWKVYIWVFIYAVAVGILSIIFSATVDNLSSDIRLQITPYKGVFTGLFFWGVINQKLVTRTDGNKESLDIGIATFYNFLKKYLITRINQNYIHQKIKYLLDKSDIDSILQACYIRIVWDLLYSDEERTKNKAYVNITFKEAYRLDERKEVMVDENGTKVKSEFYDMSLEYLKKFASIGSSNR